MPTYGIKISQEGFDVKTATNQQLVFSTDFNTYKIAKSMTVEVPFPASLSTNQVNATHGLGYPPAWAAVAYGDATTNVISVPVSAGWANIYVDTWVTATDVYCLVSNFGASSDTVFTFKVILFALDLGS